MPKLIVIEGPESGKIFELQNGIQKIGRATNNEIRLSSSSISKSHAKLIVDGVHVTIEDMESANGTFVNGILITNKRLTSGDRIYFKDTVLELLDGEEAEMAKTLSQPGTGTFGMPLPASANQPHLYLMPGMQPQAIGPRDESTMKKITGKLSKFVNEQVLPLFYAALETFEWRIVVGILFFTFIVLSVVITVAPLSTQSKQYLQGESQKRAEFIAKQLAEENRRGIYLQNEVLLSTKVAETEERVILATIVNPKGRILAPASRLNLTVTEPSSLEALKHNKTFISPSGQDRLLVSEPILVFSQNEGKNVVGGYAQVIYSLKGIGLSNTGILRIFFTALTGALLLGIIFYFIIVKITIKPLEALADDIEIKSQDGLSKLQRKYRFEALDAVLRKINTIFMKVKEENIGIADENHPQEFLLTDKKSEYYKVLSEMVEIPALVISMDGTVKEINQLAEKMLGCNAKNDIGHPLPQVIKELALASTIADLANRLASSSNNNGTEEISTPDGSSYRISVGIIRDEIGLATAAVVLIARID